MVKCGEIIKKTYSTNLKFPVAVTRKKVVSRFFFVELRQIMFMLIRPMLIIYYIDIMIKIMIPSQQLTVNNYFFTNTGCSKSLGHILTMNISETIKDIKMHLLNSESL